MQKHVHWHVFVNPASGNKAGKTIWETIVYPALLDAGWVELDVDTDTSRTVTYPTFQVTTTQRRGHAADVAREVAKVAQGSGTIKNYERGFVIIGGDGLIHEVINGILFGALPSQLPQFLLSIIPAGTGNALATSLNIGDAKDATKRLLSQSKRIRLTISTVHVGPAQAECPTEPLKYSFCVVSWGFHAQIVRQSEFLRILGGIRFKIAAILNLVLLHQYKGSLQLLRPLELELSHQGGEDETPNFVFPEWAKSSNDENQWVSLEGIADEFSYFLGTKMSSLERGFEIAPYADPASSKLDIIFGCGLPRAELANFLQHTPHIPSSVRYVKADGFKLVPKTESSRRTWSGILLHDVCVDGEMVELVDGTALWVKQMRRDDQVFEVLI